MSVAPPTATGAALDALLAAQSPSGAFGSVVDLPTGPAADENGFVTALVLHELSAWPTTPALTAARMRALDFLACCERTDRRGAFSFYPPDRQPAWMPIALLPDADDTALFTLALVDGDRWPAQRLTQAARQVLEPFRLRWVAADAKPWHREGVYLTWLDELVYPNVVDLCVNINVAALLKRAGPAHAARLAAIVDMVDAGLAWAGASPQRAFLLTPYYPHPAELGHAIDRAIRLGVTELLPCRDKLRDLGWSYAADPAGWPLDTPVCSSDDGRIVWRAPVLQQARQLCRRPSSPASHAA
ncbi:hypothetical protein [Burkholderia pseudomallei]|uniref:hypothetical protein n=1 Tax=Burkholderia pseudomallei TaxID=28450 RepID=UPI00053658CF|nr:hypothetical protein [Burkholderia pseudomallei]KGU88811.1 hypothetical protein X885_5274 [Burkholderia pseudomallei MSHR4372]